eukprot:COSAG01_NODE_2301_length_7953_cov_4.000127_8_plen_46_part_00
MYCAPIGSYMYCAPKPPPATAAAAAAAAVAAFVAKLRLALCCSEK